MFSESMDPEQLQDKYYDETINRKFAKLTTYVVQNLYFSLLPFFCKKISYIHHSLRKLKYIYLRLDLYRFISRITF